MWVVTPWPCASSTAPTAERSATLFLFSLNFHDAL